MKFQNGYDDGLLEIYPYEKIILSCCWNVVPARFFELSEHES